MPKRKALCIFTTMLGHNTTVRKLTDAFERLPGIAPTFVLVTREDYAKYPAPWWARATNPWHSQFLARQKAKETLAGQNFDLLFVNAWELVVGFQDLAQRVPAAAMLDSVPATVDLQLRDRGATDWKRQLSHLVHHRAFRRAAQKFQLFLPMGSDCGDALKKEYGIAPERCDFLTLAPQDVAASLPPEAKNYTPPTRLLFVGNDFARKGGDFLLRLYAEKLAGTCTLTIVSNDPAVKTMQLPAGVEHLYALSLEQLHGVFRDHHVFVFPTQQDFMPQVLAEALAFGLPCIANDVGGVRDLVRDGETGFLMERSASLEQWAERVRRFADPSVAAGMASGARRFAEQRLSLEVFERLLTEVTGRLQVKAQRQP